MKLQKPYLLFVGDARDDLAAKTAFGVLDWSKDDCIGQFKLPGCASSLNLPELSMAEAAQQGAKTVLIGVAVPGGRIPESWTAPMVEALRRDMSIANGLHTPLDSIAEIRAAAASSEGELLEIREPPENLPVGKGTYRSGHRLLTVGSDCSVGKMYSALAITKELESRNIEVDFRATGQTGIFIAGSGIPVDAVVADFISGSIEQLCPAAPDSHWDVIEGQGALHHPSFAGVSLGLLHGAQPDALVLCHEPTRTNMRGLPNQPMPDLSDVMELYLASARIVCENTRFVGISVNTKHVEESNRIDLLGQLEKCYQLPAVDPFVTGVKELVDHLI